MPGQVDSLFYSAWLKWARAAHHADALRRDIETWEHGAVAIAAIYDEDRQGFAMTVTEMEPMPIRWGVILGDVATNFRACFDHVAWALVQRGSATPLDDDAARNVQFPVCKRERDFKRARERRLPGVSDRDAEIVAMAQPYQADPDLRDTHALAILKRVVNKDKHQVVQPVELQTSGAHTIINSWHGCELNTEPTEKHNAEVFAIGAVVSFFDAPRVADNPTLDADVDVTARPIVEFGLPLINWLALTNDLCGALLGWLDAPPPAPALDSLGFDWRALLP